MYLAGVYRELDNPDGAMTVLKTCVEDRGHTDPCLLIAYGNELLQTGNVSEAFEMAKKSIGKAQTVCTCIFVVQCGFLCSYFVVVVNGTIEFLLVFIHFINWIICTTCNW